RLISLSIPRTTRSRSDIDSKIKASVKMGRDDIATAYIGQLQQAQLDLQRTIHQHEHSQLASKQALKARDNYMLQMQRRTAEAMQLINQSKQAKLQEQLARREGALKFLEFLKSRRFHGIPQDRFSLRKRGIQGAN